jgi:hypothetical protein
MIEKKLKEREYAIREKEEEMAAVRAKNNDR